MTGGDRIDFRAEYLWLILFRGWPGHTLDRGCILGLDFDRPYWIPGRPSSGVPRWHISVAPRSHFSEPPLSHVLVEPLWGFPVARQWRLSDELDWGLLLLLSALVGYVVLPAGSDGEVR